MFKIGSPVSEIKEITTGIPHGFNLGPLLFLSYVNDLPNCLKSSVPALFADDTNLSVHMMLLWRQRRLDSYSQSIMGNLHAIC